MKAKRRPEAAGETEPALPRHEELDLLMKQALPRLGEQFWQIAEWAVEILEGKHYERLGFVDFGEYLASRGYRYRTLRRGMAVVEAHRALPPEERPAAKAALLGIGVHKASVLAPVLALPAGQDGGRTWKEWVADAEAMTEEALQDAVSAARGVPSRQSEEPGTRWLRSLLNQVPPETKDYVEKAFRAGMKAAETVNPVRVFLLMVDRFVADLHDAGIHVDE